MNKIRTTILASALAGGSVLGFAGVVSAQTDDVVPADDAAEQPVDDTAAEQRRAKRQERRDARKEARQANRQEIADVLGLSVRPRCDV